MFSQLCRDQIAGSCSKRNEELYYMNYQCLILVAPHCWLRGRQLLIKWYKRYCDCALRMTFWTPINMDFKIEWSACSWNCSISIKCCHSTCHQQKYSCFTAVQLILCLLCPCTDCSKSYNDEVCSAVQQCSISSWYRLTAIRRFWS